ncbi:hypothetical protein GTV32_14180 [Gordonia sp. SID5947]|uniref:hypothetical protein n=1 Tax=Gordonia sp. SID5947 TaxID=2690315 RepID=UPI00136812F3|nr:hypothetical protein [Gordonia sp. SID5947]MYR07384.1 hypothetical protein [Gordonia sp. SID5947]
MDPSIEITDTITIDAYTGDAPVSGRFTADYRAWALAKPMYGRPTMRPAEPNLADWCDTRVGWGLILPERPGLTAEQLAGAGDAPEPIRELVAARNAKVLRYRAGAQFGEWALRDYAGGGDRLNADSPVGTGPQDVPKYLLIYATPAEVPWHIQYALNPVRFVGRLDLTGDALANYVAALLNDWNDATCSYASPVVWAVDHGAGDITTLMRDTVAAPIFEAFAADNEMPSATFIDGSPGQATAAELQSALATKRPALVVTSSHGRTGPLDDLDAMRENLGIPVDQDHQVISPTALLKVWQPDGAIWFAQACCSAGSDSPTSYARLFEPGTLLEQTLTGIAKVGAMTAPLARALLGAPKPLRAFIGHVEPTFNWTLSFPLNREVLTDDLKSSIYGGLGLGKPVGLAMSGYYPAIATKLQQYLRAKEDYDAQVGPAEKKPLDMLVYSRVTAHDRASTVILGDPTAALSLPGN